MSQAWHWPAQGTSQQTPSTQLPLTQSVIPVHTWPLGLCWQVLLSQLDASPPSERGASPPTSTTVASPSFPSLIVVASVLTGVSIAASLDVTFPPRQQIPLTHNRPLGHANAGAGPQASLPDGSTPRPPQPPTVAATRMTSAARAAAPCSVPITFDKSWSMRAF
jgi:hypothetical protein